MTSSSQQYFEKITNTSEYAKFFTMPSNPMLGKNHPLNTFRTPFAPDRRKVSWYFKTVKCCQNKTPNLEFRIGLTLNKELDFDALLTSRLVFSKPPPTITQQHQQNKKKIVELDKTKYVNFENGLIQNYINSTLIHEPAILSKSRPAVIEEFTPQTAKIQNSVGQWRTDFNFDCGDIPWFYSLNCNRFFPMFNLKDGSCLLHKFTCFMSSPKPLSTYCCEANKLLKEIVPYGSIIETEVCGEVGEEVMCCNSIDYFDLVLTVAFLSEMEKEYVEKEMYKPAFLPAKVVNSCVISEILNRSVILKSGVEYSSLPKTAIYAFMWRRCSSPQQSNISIDINGHKLFENIPSNFFEKNEDGWMIWSSMLDKYAPYPPPMLTSPHSNNTIKITYGDNSCDIEFIYIAYNLFSFSSGILWNNDEHYL